MKNNIIVLFFIAFLGLLAGNDCRAAFPAHLYKKSSCKLQQTNHLGDRIEKLNSALWNFPKKLFTPQTEHHVSEGGTVKTGWQGIASFVCAIAALVNYYLFIPLSICAFVLGIIGSNKKKHYNTKWAVAGLVIGSIEILIMLLVAIIIVALTTSGSFVL
jgi:hypothetical protein